MIWKLTRKTDSVLVREIGELLYGERWQRQFSRASGVSQARLSEIANADQHYRMTDDVRAKLAAAVSTWLADLNGRRERGVSLRTTLVQVETPQDRKEWPCPTPTTT